MALPIRTCWVCGVGGHTTQFWRTGGQRQLLLKAEAPLYRLTAQNMYSLQYVPAVDTSHIERNRIEIKIKFGELW